MNVDKIAIGEEVDKLVTLDVLGRGLIQKLYSAAREKHDRPLCLESAESLRELCKDGGAACFITGLPLRGARKEFTVTETDGPPGAAVLARALSLAFRVTPLFLTGEGLEKPVMAAAKAVGFPCKIIDFDKLLKRNLAKLDIPGAFVSAFPAKEGEAQEAASKLVDTFSPTVAISVEMVGRNKAGDANYNDDITKEPSNLPHFDAFFTAVRQKGVFSIGIGDGGNEIGMGNIYKTVVKELGNLTAAVSCTDILVPAVISNWGAYGIVACLAALMNDQELLHTPEAEKRLIRSCVDSGAAHGPSVRLEYKVDWLSLNANAALTELLSNIVISALKGP